TIEPMSSLAEPPSTPDEIEHYMTDLASYHQDHLETTVPAYLCGDISHGIADRDRNIVHDNYDLFEFSIPYMWEFHFKNTDSFYNSTFGFTDEECRNGIVDLPRLKDLIFDNTERWPIDDVFGYLEIGGPKLGRDYSDPDLEKNLVESIRNLRRVFD
ncbi:MAG: hypothetical protein HN368_01100, partial [Spirochaetales bacterium]|nr:hypothetical protein [Spirochaetales bacterium]